MSCKWSITGVIFVTFSALTAHAAAVSIKVVQGAGAINSIKFRHGHDPVVQVIGESGESIAGATVTFLLPASGPSGTFGDKGLSLSVQTDTHGMATARSLKPNKVEGQFRIRVTTSWHGESASTTLLQTNAEPGGRSSSSKWVVIAVVVGGAAAGGLVAATHGGSPDAATQPPVSTPPGSAIVAGTPSFGPPR
jgi:hypothetical protein